MRTPIECEDLTLLVQAAITNSGISGPSFGGILRHLNSSAEPNWSVWWVQPSDTYLQRGLVKVVDELRAQYTLRAHSAAAHAH